MGDTQAGQNAPARTGAIFFGSFSSEDRDDAWNSSDAGFILWTLFCRAMRGLRHARVIPAGAFV